MKINGNWLTSPSQLDHISYDKFEKFIREHTGSDYALRYKKELMNKAGVEIKSYPINIIDIYKWGSIVKESNKFQFKGDEEIVNIYLTEISKYYNTQFRKDFIKQQAFITSYFGIYYSLEIIGQWGFSIVNIFYSFLNDTRQGWVLPIEQKVLDLSFPDPRGVEKVNNFLSHHNDDIYNFKSEFSRILEALCSFISEAEKYISVNDFNQAFTNIFVGLDYFLSPDSEKSKKLKQRISLIVYSDLSISFEKQLEKLDILYDVRSNYIHNGISVKEEDLIELRKIARVVLSVLLEVHKMNRKNKKLDLSEWIKKLDTLVQNIYKGEKPNAKQFREIGVNDKRSLYLQESLDKLDV